MQHDDDTGRDEVPEEKNDVDFEADTELADTGAALSKLKKVKEELAKVKQEKQDYLDGWQRCKADSVNLRKDLEARAKRSAEMLREALVHDILPALDSFDMAAGSEAWSEVSAGWRSGMEHVRNQLLEALRAHGIERFGKVGEQVDHSFHDIAEERDDMPGESGTIARILRYGYRSGERILRPAQVIVKK